MGINPAWRFVPHYGAGLLGWWPWPFRGRCRGKATWSVLVGQGLPGGQVTTGAVHLGARAARPHRPGTALDGSAPAPPVQPGSEQQLLVDGERAGVDVAPDHVGVGRLQVDRRPRPGGPGSARGSQGHEPRCSPPSGPRTPHRSGPVRPDVGPQGVANRPGRDMGVAPQGVLAGRGPARVGQRLLAQDERWPSGQQPVERLPDGLADRRDRIADMDHAGTPRPATAPAAQRPVELEVPSPRRYRGSWAGCVTGRHPVRPAGSPAAGPARR